MRQRTFHFEQLMYWFSLFQDGFAVPDDDGSDLLPPEHIEEY